MATERRGRPRPARAGTQAYNAGLPLANEARLMELVGSKVVRLASVAA